MPDETERLLTSLIPASSLDRDEVMFRAGRASARGWVWPIATLVSTSAAAVLAVLLALGPRGGEPPARQEDTAGSRPAARPAESPAAPEEPAPLIAARRLEQQILLHGLEGLGHAAPLAPPPDFNGDI